MFHAGKHFPWQFSRLNYSRNVLHVTQKFHNWIFGCDTAIHCDASCGKVSEMFSSINNALSNSGTFFNSQLIADVSFASVY